MGAATNLARRGHGDSLPVRVLVLTFRLVELLLQLGDFLLHRSETLRLEHKQLSPSVPQLESFKDIPVR